MWIKICGNTNLEDARLAVELGADALGFVFGPSKREVNAGQVAEITRQLSADVAKIGVFQTQDFEEIAGTIREAGLTGAQLHGGFSPELIAALRREFSGALGELGEMFVIQTMHWKNEGQTAEAFRAELDQLRVASGIDAGMVDSRTATAAGGTGVPFDWKAARAVLAGLGGLPLIVAGGLTPANVGEAIAVLDPWGVDVVTGVEAQPGRKDPEKLAEFMRMARGLVSRT
jgi:phosphoribosylanthranilate isomerase